MIGRVWAVSLNTFREAIRNKILYAFLAVVIAANLFAIVLGAMSMNEEARVARDVGLAGVSIFGAFTAIVQGVSLLYTEVQKKTIHVILAKPLERHEFAIGKYLGMVITLTVLVVAFSIALAATLELLGTHFDTNIAKAVVLGWLGVLVVAAIAIFFSSFTSPFLSGTFSLALFIIGRSADDLRWAADRSKIDVIRVVSKVALYIVPDLHVFSISGGEVNGQPVSVNATFVGWDYVGTSALYALAVIGILLTLAIIIFRRRDFV